MACYVLAMSRASSRALKHPPVTAPSEPAGALSPFPELAVAIERERVVEHYDAHRVSAVMLAEMGVTAHAPPQEPVPHA